MIALRPDPTLLSRLMAEAKRRGLALPTARGDAPRKIEWTPQPGPQTEAYNSEADVIGYGGAAGGGKSDLLLGMAGTKHHRAIIFRRMFPLLEGLIARSKDIYGAGSFNQSLHLWDIGPGRTVRFAAMQYEDDKKKFQGRPHDFIGIDEATEFSESQVRFVSAWLRTTIFGQRTRLMMTFNPPMDDAGEWVTRYFAPWLDPQHPRPARDGELRWYAMVDGKEVETPNGTPFEHAGETVTPKSRTFFHAALADNPALAVTGYAAQIDALPEPLRSILKGSFNAARVANPFQVIPAAWVKAAQARWHETKSGRMEFIGADISRGGADQTVIAPLRGLRFDELQAFPGAGVPDGQTAAALIMACASDNAVACVDVIGVGASAFDHLRGANHPTIPVNFAGGTTATDRSGRINFVNVRAAAYWAMREALDPANNSGIALPPDSELLSDLCAANWKLSAGRIQIEPKENIAQRIGRSPDRADAVVLAWWGKLVYLTAIAQQAATPQIVYNPVKIGDW